VIHRELPRAATRSQIMDQLSAANAGCGASAAAAIAQINPSSSRPTAAKIWSLFFPRASSRAITANQELVAAY